MISPEDIWETLDALALERGLTPSGLARAAGLDPTTFNPSRRCTASEEMRWMALPSLLQALESLKISPALFFRRLEGVGRGVEDVTVRRIRGLPLSRLSGEGLFDASGHPTGSLWDEMTLPCSVAPGAYAVRVDTDALEPLLREGSSLVLLPDAPPRRSDRVLLLRSGLEPVLGILEENPVPASAGAGTRRVVRLFTPGSCVQAPKDYIHEPGGADSGGSFEPAVRQGLEVEGAVPMFAPTAVPAVMPVPEEKPGVWLHRVVMGTF